MGTYRVDIAAISSKLDLVKYRPKGMEFIFSKGCNPNQPTIGDTRTSHQILKAFSSNIK
jgi:hypothetical protein